jgi:hypothetical protein
MNPFNRKPQKNNPDEPELQDFARRLEDLRFEPRPEFRDDLKNRLLASLQEEATPARAGWWQQFLASWKKPRAIVGFGLGTLGAVAALVLIISVASVLNNPVLVTPVAVNSTPLAVPSLASTASVTQSPALTFYNVATKSYVNLQEAEKLAGFAASQPGYLPSGYAFKSANVIALPERAMPVRNFDIRGYNLRYEGVKAPGKNTPELEVTQVTVPFNLRIGQNGARTDRNTLPMIMGSQATTVKITDEITGYFIQGRTWNLTVPNGARPEGEIGQTTPPTPRPAIGNRNDAIEVANFTFGRNDANRPGFSIGFGNRPGAQSRKVLIWQQDKILVMLSADDSLSEAEMVKVAQGLVTEAK